MNTDNKEMGTRVRALVEIKAGGNRRAFCALLDWSPQYLNKIINGENIGLTPVMSLLRVFPDLDARWLLFGEGAMLDCGINAIKDRLRSLISIERYMPVMSPDEIAQVEAGRVDWDICSINAWQEKLRDRDERAVRAMHP